MDERVLQLPSSLSAYAPTEKVEDERKEAFNQMLEE